MRNTGAELHADGRTRDVAIKAVAVRLRTTQLPAAGRHYHLRLLRPAVAALPPTQSARRRRRPFRSERTGSTRVQAPQVPGVTRSWQLLRQVCRVEKKIAVVGWRRSIVVRTLVLAGELSLSCARLLAGCVTTLRLSHPLSVTQHGQLSHPSLRGR